MDDMQGPPARVTVPWRHVAVVLVLGVLWGAFWVHRESGRLPSGQPTDPPSPSAPSPSSLSPRALALCGGLETGHADPADAVRLGRLLDEADPGEAEALVVRMVEHALDHPGTSPYLPFLAVRSREAGALLMQRVSRPGGALPVVEVLAELATTGDGRALRPGADDSLRGLLFGFLTWHLGESDDDAVRVRSAALGVAVRLRDPACLPWLRELAEREHQLDLRATAVRLVEALDPGTGKRRVPGGGTRRSR